MRKLKLIFVMMTILFFSHAFAETLNADYIKDLHAVVKASAINNCNATIKGANEEICKCFGEKADKYLDDEAVSKCTNDEAGSVCAFQAAQNARTMAFSKDMYAECFSMNEAKEKVTTASAPIPTQ